MPPAGRTGPEPGPPRSGPAGDDRFAALVALGFEPAAPEPQTLAADWRDGRFALAQERPGMGTRVAVSVRADGPWRAERAIGLAFEALDRLTALLNRYDPGSALSSLNELGRLRDAPPELTEVLDLSLAIGRRSRGAFDPTVAPLVDLFGGGVPRVPPQALFTSMAGGGAPAPRELRPPPAAADLRAALDLLGADRVRRDGRSVRLEREGMRLTLDGIAKGWIVDEMAAALEREGIADYLVEAGGDIRVSGAPEPGRAWTIGVRDPGGSEELPDRIALPRGAVATSGSYEQYFDPERTRHHIVSGALGGSPSEVAAVTVTAPTAALADALATAAFVLGPDRGPRFIASMDGCECLVIAPDGTRTASPGWATLSLSGR